MSSESDSANVMLIECDEHEPLVENTSITVGTEATSQSDGLRCTGDFKDGEVFAPGIDEELIVIANGAKKRMKTAMRIFHPQEPVILSDPVISEAQEMNTTSKTDDRCNAAQLELSVGIPPPDVVGNVPNPSQLLQGIALSTETILTTKSASTTNTSECLIPPPNHPSSPLTPSSPVSTSNFLESLTPPITFSPNPKKLSTITSHMPPGQPNSPLTPSRLASTTNNSRSLISPITSNNIPNSTSSMPTTLSSLTPTMSASTTIYPESLIPPITLSPNPKNKSTCTSHMPSNHPNSLLTPPSALSKLSQPNTTPTPPQNTISDPSSTTLASNPFPDISSSGLTAPVANMVVSDSKNKSSSTPHPGSIRQTASWSSVVSSSDLSLNFVKPTFLDDNISFVLPKGLARYGEDKWANTLVGFFIEKRLPLSVLIPKIQSVWASHGLMDITTTHDGFLLFKFNSAEDVKIISNKAPWVFNGQAIFLKPWSRNFDFSKEEFKAIPVWVKLFGIPSIYWTKEGLSAIASRLGIPLYMDAPTMNARRLEFARVCVQMKMTKIFPNKFEVQSEFGEKFEVRLEYSWRPTFCSKCDTIGHTTFKCPSLPPHLPNKNNPKPSYHKNYNKKQPFMKPNSNSQSRNQSNTQPHPKVHKNARPKYIPVEPSSSNGFKFFKVIMPEESTIQSHDKLSNVSDPSTSQAVSDQMGGKLGNVLDPDTFHEARSSMGIAHKKHLIVSSLEMLSTATDKDSTTTDKVSDVPSTLGITTDSQGLESSEPISSTFKATDVGDGASSFIRELIIDEVQLGEQVGLAKDSQGLEPSEPISSAFKEPVVGNDASLIISELTTDEVQLGEQAGMDSPGGFDKDHGLIDLSDSPSPPMNSFTRKIKDDGVIEKKQFHERKFGNQKISGANLTELVSTPSIPNV